MERYTSLAFGVVVGIAITQAGLPAASLALPPGSAEAPAEERVVYQDTVVVRATKLPSRLGEFPSAIAVIGPQQIRLGTARSVHDVVRGVPGLNIVDLSGSETGGQVESRGFTSLGFTSHVRVLIDEMPVNDLEGDRVDWNLIDLAQLERVELLRGPTAFLYGNAAMAGIINLVSRTGAVGMRPWGQFSGGSGRLWSGAGGASFGSRSTEGGISWSYRDAQGIRDHSASENWSAHGQLRRVIGPRWNGRLRLLAHRGVQEIPGALPDPAWGQDPEQAGTPEDFRDHVAVNGLLEISNPVTEPLHALVVVGADHRRLDSRETIVPVGALDRSSRARSMRAEARLNWRPRWLPLGSVLIGGEVDRGGLESRYFDRTLPDPLAPAGAGDVLRTAGGLFVLAQYGREAPWTVMAGARRDWLRSSVDDPSDAAPRAPDNDLSAFSPTLGLNVRLPNSGHAYAFYSGSFKAPNLEQLYDQRPFTLDFDGPGPSPPFVLRLSSNVLQPQRGHHFETGARSRLWEGIWSDMAVYYSRSKDEVGFDLANFRYSNIDRSIHYGLEVQLAGTLAKRWSGQVSGTLTRTRFDGGPDDGNQVNGVPEQQYFARVSVEHGLGGTVTLEARYVRNQWLDEANAVEIPQYGILDLGVTQGVGRVELFLSARNLADKRFAEAGYLTRDALGADLPLYYPGAGRSVRVGLRLPGPPAGAGPAHSDR